MDRLRLRSDIPGHNSPMENTSSSSSSSNLTASHDTGRLVIGRDVVLSGEISSCADLLIEGTVKATLKDGQHVEITETGRFDGDLEVENAEISGFFEGTLKVTDRLVLRPSAEIKGELIYGTIEVHPGARIEGKMTALERPAEIAPVIEETAEISPKAEAAVQADHNAFDMNNIISRIAGNEDSDEETGTTLPFRTAVNG